MSRIICMQHPGYAGLLWITDDMKDLEKSVKDDFSLKVDLVPCGYYFKNVERYVGYIGYSGKPDEVTKVKDNFPEQLLTLDIGCLCTPDLPVNELKQLVSRLNVTKGGRDNQMNPLQINKKHPCVTSCLYLYKKSGFDEAFQALNKMIPSLTEKRFSKLNLWNSAYDSVDYVNEDLVETTSEYRGEDMLLKRREFKEVDANIVSEYHVTLSIIATDIKTNTDDILGIMDFLSQYLV